jgi:hypothetical protein
MSGWAATNLRTNPSWAARADPLGAPIAAGATLPMRFQRCTSLIAQLWLTANRAAAARRDSPPSTALTIRLRRSKERGRAIHAGLLSPSPQLESRFKPDGDPPPDSFFLEFALVLLRHKSNGAEGRVRQQEHRGKVLTRASINRRRMVAIEFGMCRSGRRGGASGSITAG